MEIQFKTKRPKRIDDITKELTSFLLINKNYIEMTFFIIATYKESNDIEEIEESIELLLIENDIEEDDNFTKYIELLREFYIDNSKLSHEKSKLSDRRGDILESIVENINPIHVKDANYKTYRECIILDGNKEISQQDIDVIYASEDNYEAELIECKADLESFLGETIPYKKRRKLDFMKDAKCISSSYGGSYENILATCLLDDTKSRKVLDEQGYHDFRVITGIDILKGLK